MPVEPEATMDFSASPLNFIEQTAFQVTFILKISGTYIHIPQIQYFLLYCWKFYPYLAKYGFITYFLSGKSMKYVKNILDYWLALLCLFSVVIMTFHSLFVYCFSTSQFTFIWIINAQYRMSYVILSYIYVETFKLYIAYGCWWSSTSPTASLSTRDVSGP